MKNFPPFKDTYHILKIIANPETSNNEEGKPLSQSVIITGLWYFLFLKDYLKGKVKNFIRDL